MKLLRKVYLFFGGSVPQASNTIASGSFALFLLHKAFEHGNEPLCFTVHEGAFLILIVYLIMQITLANIKQED